MSDLQHDWWFRELHSPNPGLLICGFLSIDGELDTTALAIALRRLITRHEALRTTFASAHALTTQLIWPPPAEAPLRVVDLSALSEPRLGQELRALLEQERARPFRLGAEPPIRVTLVRIAPGRCILAVTTHEFIADGWAHSMAVRELGALYEAARSAVGDGLKPPMQFREWVARERDRTAGAEGERQLAYWRTTLRRLQPVHLPGDREPSPDRHFSAAEHHFTVPATTAERIPAVALRHRATPSTLGLAALLAVLATRTGRADAAATTLLHRRNDRAVRGVMGCVHNTIAVHVGVDRGGPPDRLLTDVQSQVLAGYAHQDVFITRVLEAVDLEPGAIDAVYIYDPYRPMWEKFAGHPARWYTDLGPRSFRRCGRRWENLLVRLQQTEDGFIGAFTYNAEVYSASTMAAVADDYVDRLAWLCGPQ